MKLNAYLVPLLLPTASAFQVPHRSFISERNIGFRPLPQYEVSTVSTFTALRSVSNSIDKEDQVTHTAERLAGISRAEVKHIFDDLDADGKYIYALLRF